MRSRIKPGSLMLILKARSCKQWTTSWSYQTYEWIPYIQSAHASKVIDKLFFTFSWLQFSYHKVSSFYQLSSTNSSSIMSRWPSIECKVFPILFETLVLGWTIRFLVSTDGGKTSQERTERSWSRICWYERKIMCGHRTDNGWTIYFDLYHLCASTSW